MNVFPFPSETVRARRERAFDRIASVALRGWIPFPRLHIRTKEGGLDMRWLELVTIAFQTEGGRLYVGKVSQWIDDDPMDILVVLGSPAGVPDVSLLPQPGQVSFLAGDCVRTFLFGPAP